MRIFSIASLGAALLVAGCVSSTEPASGQTIDRTYKVDGFRWDSGTTVYVLLKAYDADGKVGVCGAWSARGGSATISNLHTDVLAAGILTIDGERLLQGLNFLAEHGPEGELVGKTSNCVVVDKPWKKSFRTKNLDLDFPRMRFIL